MQSCLGEATYTGASPPVAKKYSGQQDLDVQIALWLDWDRNDKTKNEIQKLVGKEDWATLRKRLLERITFGTAGLRGVMRAGFDSMNDLVIIQTAQGLCDYVLKEFPSKCWADRGVVFGYDGRHHSKRFAQLSACIFTQRGVKTYLFGAKVITPFVPFAITQLKCMAGVMVTASHNPKEDNGYKVYWSNGAQIIPPHDKGIQNAILYNLKPLDSSWDINRLTNCPLLVDPFDKLFEKYFKLLKQTIPTKYLENNAESSLRFVYTAMHGVGWPFAKEAFRVAHLKPLIGVKEQINPDPEFPTVKFPNPEEGKSALELAMKTADDQDPKVTIILANDPDADRLACAEKDPNTLQWKVFTGNELGALLGWWAAQVYQTFHPGTDFKDCYMLASTVSSKILRAMSKVEGFSFVETLTGFKWMGNRAHDLESNHNEVLFAFEEAIGFMFSTMVLDKDGISAACQLATMACYIKKSNKMTLKEKLDEIYSKYGYHCTNNSYLFCYEPDIIKRIFDRLRYFDEGNPNTYPKSILNGEFKIQNVRDLTTGYDSSEPDQLAKLPVSSSSEMITFNFENGLVITLRTSGTEPKIKYYAELCADREEKDFQKLRTTLDRMVNAVIEEFLQPQKNNLTAKKD